MAEPTERDREMARGLWYPEDAQWIEDRTPHRCVEHNASVLAQAREEGRKERPWNTVACACCDAPATHVCPHREAPTCGEHCLCTGRDELRAENERLRALLREAYEFRREPGWHERVRAALGEGGSDART